MNLLISIHIFEYSLTMLSASFDTMSVSAGLLALYFPFNAMRAVFIDDYACINASSKRPLTLTIFYPPGMLIHVPPQFQFDMVSM